MTFNGAEDNYRETNIKRSFIIDLIYLDREKQNYADLFFLVSMYTIVCRAGVF